MKPALRTAVVTALLLSATGAVKGECPQLQSGLQVGTVAHASLKEISGIAPQVWALSIQGTHLGTYNLTNASLDDWEDMAIGPGPEPNKDYLYIGDVGNNEGLVNHTYSIYRVPEPNVSASQEPVNVNLSGVDTLLVEYPDSLRHGCETILVDPVNSDIYLCTRDRWGDDNGVMKVYRYPAPHTPDDPCTMQHAADVQLIVGEMAVGGDISLDGSLVIIRTKGEAERALLWQRDAGTDLWDAFDNPMCVVPSLWEPQGEAICFDANGCGYYTTSEYHQKHHPDGVPIYYFAREGQCPVITGDFEPDGDVDFADFAVLGSAWRSRYGGGNWNPICDISEPNDNVINESDLDVFTKNWLTGL